MVLRVVVGGERNQEGRQGLGKDKKDVVVVVLAYLPVYVVYVYMWGIGRELKERMVEARRTHHRFAAHRTNDATQPLCG